MTKKEFMKEFKNALAEEKSAEPFLGVFKSIRIKLRGISYCPITFVCHQKQLGSYETNAWREAAPLLHLGPLASRQIVRAADNMEEPDLHNQLLEICGFVPKATV